MYLPLKKALFAQIYTYFFRQTAASVITTLSFLLPAQNSFFLKENTWNKEHFTVHNHNEKVAIIYWLNLPEDKTEQLFLAGTSISFLLLFLLCNPKKGNLTFCFYVSEIRTSWKNNNKINSLQGLCLCELSQSELSQTHFTYINRRLSLTQKFIVQLICSNFLKFVSLLTTQY